MHTAVGAGRSAAAVNHVKFFAGLVRGILSILLANLARTILPFWAGSVAAFALVAAWIHVQMRASEAVPEVLRWVSSEMLFGTYVLLGLIAGTLPAIAFAAVRSIAPLERLLQDRLGRLIDTLVSSLPSAPSSMAVDVAERRMLEALAAIRHRAGRLTRFVSPAGAVTAWLTRRVERELHLELAADLAAAAHARARADGTLAAAMSRVQARVVEGIGDEVRRRAWWGRVIASAIWILLLLVAALPVLLLRWWLPR